LKNNSTGSYEFGLIRSSSYTGSKAFVSQTLPAIVDSGTEVLMLQKPIVDAFYAQVPGAAWDAAIGNYVYPCTSKGLLPSITVGVGSHRIVIPGSYLHWGTFSSGGNYWCYSLVYPTAAGDTAILGETLIKAQFVVFDFAGKRVGFADKKLS
jgi:hypothetical protein